MESYRYQLRNQADFGKLIDFLMREKCNFASSFHYDGEGMNNHYIVTIYLDDPDTDPKVPKITDYIDQQEVSVTEIKCVSKMYNTPGDAARDVYADPESLRKNLNLSLGQIDVLNSLLSKSTEEEAKLEDAVRNEKTDKEYYQHSYFKALETNKRIREQARAIAWLLDSIFPNN